MGLKLTPFRGKAQSTLTRNDRRALTTVPGFENSNRQQVVGSTGAASASFRGQRVYRVKCLKCAKEYGSNGCDIHTRRCPHCDGGAPGESLVDDAPMFDFAAAE